MMWLHVVAEKSELMMFSGFHLYRILGDFLMRCCGTKRVVSNEFSINNILCKPNRTHKKNGTRLENPANKVKKNNAAVGLER